jgi:outer membrane protein assembly factor BamE (lipoprotein component of BamABCDE complex)
MKKNIFLFLIVIAYGCATTSKMNSISLGMSKAEVIEIMGKPVSTSAVEGTQYLNYTLTDPVYYTPDFYYVCIREGKVFSYGRMGDFDSTKDPTQVIKVIGDVKSDETVNIKTESSGELENKLKMLNKLLADELITKSDFDEQKKKLLNDYTNKQN